MNKLRFGVISASGMAQAHMDAIVFNKNTELIAICDIDNEKLAVCTEKYGVPGYTDYKELLKREDIDAVVICTPDQLHREMLEEALKNGKHVLCEKPMALTEDDCKAMVKAANASDKKVMVGQICRYTPGFVRAKELIDAGEIGEFFAAIRENRPAVVTPQDSRNVLEIVVAMRKSLEEGCVVEL